MSAVMDHAAAFALTTGRSPAHLLRPPVRTIEVEVTRRIARPVRPVVATLEQLSSTPTEQRVPLGEVGWLSLDAESACVGLDGSSWRGRAHLHDRRRWPARPTTVDVEISAWSPDASQVQLRAQGEPTRWGRRRLARYFTLAHLAADHLRRELADRATDRVVSPARVQDRPAAHLAPRHPEEGDAAA